jgi:hypothetical protein
MTSKELKEEEMQMTLKEYNASRSQFDKTKSDFDRVFDIIMKIYDLEFEDEFLRRRKIALINFIIEKNKYGVIHGVKTFEQMITKIKNWVKNFGRMERCRIRTCRRKVENYYEEETG